MIWIDGCAILQLLSVGLICFIKKRFFGYCMFGPKMVSFTFYVTYALMLREGAKVEDSVVLALLKNLMLVQSGGHRALMLLS